MSQLLSMSGINKSFYGVKVLKDVDFDLQSGEIHVLLGQNGAGKSTLIKILSGAYRADTGSVTFDGREIDLIHFDPIRSEEQGVITIYQNFHLIPNLTVAENLSLHQFTESRKPINWREVKRHAHRALEGINFTIDIEKKVKSLPVSQKQMLEIAIALSKNARIVIMDEPTAALSDREVSLLFDTIRNLKSRGIGIIYISHKLEEIREIGDRVTILRDGENVATVDPRTTEIDKIISLMIGRRLSKERVYRKFTDTEPLLETLGLQSVPLTAPASIQLKRNEILGITGLVGAGKTELARTLFGVEPVIAGELRIDGGAATVSSPREAMARGLGYLPEDRDNDGLFLNLSVKKNLSISLLSKLKKQIFGPSFDNAIAEEIVEAIKIKTAGFTQLVKYLSGGNKQKVVFGKWLKANCRVLLLDEPTIGIDIGARGEIYDLIREFADNGSKGVIVFSSDMDEILDVADRILVMAKGAIVQELDPETTSKQEMMRYAVVSKGA